MIPTSTSQPLTNQSRLVTASLISATEWRWLIAWAAFIMVITSLPYLYGWAISTPDRHFSGAIIGLEDANSYLAKMRLGRDGAWQFHLVYTPEPHQGAFVFTFYLLLGKLAGALNLPLIIVFHLARLFFGIGFLLTIYRFIAQFVTDLNPRRFAFLLVAAGSGLGWLVVGLGLVPVLGLPLDVYLPEGFVFLVLFHLPHLALAESLLLASLLLTWQSWHSPAWGKPIALASLALLLMVTIAGFYLAVFAVVLALAGLFRLLIERDWLQLWLRFYRALIPLLVATPLTLYYLAVFATNPVFKVWNQQNLILSPAVEHYLLAYGSLIVSALVGGAYWVRKPRRQKLPLTHRLRRLKPGFWLLLAWAVAWPLLVYLPFNLQRRLVVGAQIALSILATQALFALTRAYLSPIARRLLLASSLIFFSLSNLMLLFGSVVTVAGQAPPVFQTAGQLAAVNWLAGHSQGEVVLASHDTGNFLPVYADVRTFVGHGPETVHAAEKQAQVKRFFGANTPDAWRLDLLRRFRVRYLYYGPGEATLGDFRPEQATYLVERYGGDGIKIFEVLLPAESP